MLERWTNRVRGLGARLAALGRARLLAVAVLGSMVVLGGLALLGRAGPASVPAAARESADASGEPLEGLRAAAGDGDVWMTQAQRTRQWQVARMEALGGLIGRFPAVERATVLIEPGRAGAPGVPPQGPTAAVQVSFAPGQSMTPELLRAMIDLLSGATSGLDPERVCVIDQAGCSYRLADADGREWTSARVLRQQARWEERYRQRVLSALPMLSDPAVVVRTARSEDGTFRPVGAVLAGEARPGCPAAAVLGELAAATLGLSPADVAVRILDTTRPAKVRAQVTDPWRLAWAVTLAVVELGLLGAIVARRVHRRRRALAWGRVRAAARRRRDRHCGSTQSDEPLQQLRHATVEDLVTILSQEPAETVAVVLSHLGAARASRVLGGLSGAMQVQVTRRLAAFDEIDPATVRAVEQDLAERLGALDCQPVRPAGGVRAVARILHHAGQHGRRNVLEALAEKEPRLAATISRQLLGFEDIARIPADRLGPALASLDIRELALALWTAEPAVQQRVLSALPGERRMELQEALDGSDPVRLSQVDSAQQQVVQTVREYEEAQAAHVGAGRKEHLA